MIVVAVIRGKIHDQRCFSVCPETTGSQKRRLNAMRPLFRDDSTNGETRITIFFKIMRDRIDV
jgi:hypothetical protein